MNLIPKNMFMCMDCGDFYMNCTKDHRKNGITIRTRYRRPDIQARWDARKERRAIEAAILEGRDAYKRGRL